MTPMNRFHSKLGEFLAAHFTPTGRERGRRLRQAETEAMVAADRMQLARLLTTVGDYHLGLAELHRPISSTEAPEPADRRRWVLDSLADAIRDEIDRFAQHRSEGPRC